MDGVLVIDKPKGPTSHDVVARVRRTLGTRRVGHAGTLDPMASGVLVVLVGEGTKLAPFLTAHDKRYDARVVLGSATDTLDAEGTVTTEAPLPPWLVEEIEHLAGGSPAPRIEAALAAERARALQTPPAFSAIKIAGQKSYDRARRGEEVELADRPVEVAHLEARAAGPVDGGTRAFLDVSLAVSKGYYVRSLARDLGAALSVPAHLGALRRTQSGPFGLDRACPLSSDRTALAAAVVPLAAAAASSLSAAHLTAEGVLRASQGKRLGLSDFGDAPHDADAPFAWLSPHGHLVAVGNREGDDYVVQRGFVVSLVPGDPTGSGEDEHTRRV
jgi:tRNA pseudouridine55 synthase